MTWHHRYMFYLWHGTLTDTVDCRYFDIYSLLGVKLSNPLNLHFHTMHQHQQTNWENQIKKWNVCPQLVVLVPPVAAARAGWRVRARRLLQLRSDFPSHWSGGGRDGGIRDSVWESLRNPRIGALNILAFHHSDSSLLSSWLPALPIDQKFLSRSSFARGRKTFYKYLYLSQRLSCSSLLLSSALTLKSHLKH